MHPRRLPCRVVSVGSLLVGGSGKTPLAAWVAGRLRGRGHRVVLASRGYGRARRDAVHALTDGRPGYVQLLDDATRERAQQTSVPSIIQIDAN